MAEEQGFSKGLAGVVADATSVSQVQGEVGKLIYRGISIEELAEKSTYEECVYFSLYGKLPTQNQFNKFLTEMKANRVLPKTVEAVISAAPRSAHPMAVLQAAIAAIGFDEQPVNLKNEEHNIHSAIKIISQLATAVARISRERRGLQAIAPNPDLSHAENFLYMLNGNVPNKEEARMFDVALILHLDHDFNASTFAARVVASTEAKLSLSISAAIGALSGPLHGGANEKVLEMADAIGAPENAKAWVANALATKAKVMGFGHRVYRTMDPRAKVLRGMLEKLVASKKEKDTYETLRIVHDSMIEELSKTSKDYIWPNVDFWSGALYRLMGIESIDFTPIFAVSRVAGWSSHIVEMWRDNRIYRPAAKYVGPADDKYVDIKNRK
ncbi:citrate/2-methylcitrate synthase [Pigmentibacter sp. JX0631]|uniref:citrate/2-methylcitrate synthase n=1 Tax=Pigmentibacter sp. JX0631 TaxID=2976982 RepID=UPI0024685977|nr:citrate/2-methylcitrate synthase [Pigmentibacter sp. JX0631]WGL61038.1 citrate/2-methylcitrate synthase [Pigmentibacter sp. JX0631]